MHPVSISNDFTIALVPMPLCPHPYFGPQGNVPLGVALDVPVPMYWPPGFALGTTQMTTTVLHRGLPVVLEGHDCGPGILHVQVAPDPLNAYSPLHMMFSSRKVNFFASTKVFDGKCVGLAKLLALPPTPMTSCGDPVSVPGTGVPTNRLNSLLVHLPWVDALIGWATVAAELLIDTMLFIDGIGDPPKGFGRQVLEGLGISEGAALKQGLAVATGIARMSLTDGPASLEVKVGSAYMSGRIGVTRDADGGLSGSISGKALHYGGEVGQDQDSYFLKTEERGLADVSKVERRPGEDPVVTKQQLGTNSWREWGKPT